MEKIKNKPISKKEWISAVFFQALAAAAGFLSSRAAVLSSFAPFGMAVAAGVPNIYSLSASIFAAAGYFMPVNGEGAFRYIVALFAICVIRMLLAGVGRLSEKPAWSAVIAGSASAATALANVAGGGLSLSFAVVESVLAAAGAYFVHRVSSIAPNERNALSPEQSASVIIVINILLLGLYPIGINGISLGRILAMVGIMAVASCSFASGGAVSGCITALFLLLCGEKYASAAVVLASGGLVCGIFAPLGIFPTAICFTLWGCIGALLVGGGEIPFTVLAETAFAAALFIILPKSLRIKYSKLFYPPVRVPTLDGMKRAITMRLFFASKALEDVSETVSEVSSELALINAPEFNDVIDGIKCEACKGCTYKTRCWERNEKKMHDEVLSLTRQIKSGTFDGKEDFFEENCLRPKRLYDATHRFFDEYVSKITAEARIEEIRSIVSDQFDGVSKMLYDLGCEFDANESYDNLLAKRLSDALCDNGIHISDCAVRHDKFDRICAEMRMNIPSNAVLNRLDILKIAENICEREFEAPIINRAKGEALIKLCEKADFSVSLGVCQLASAGASVCGDAYTSFLDGKGREIIILSDGMGTGARAAVDGAMASGLLERLLKADFGYDCALKIVNSSMLFKSTDESLATLDVSVIDLFSGKTDMLKAGAAPTFLKRQGRTGKAQSTSLPTGILSDVGFDKASVSLKAGDVLLMVSDGVMCDGSDWICAELESFSGGSAQALADRIAFLAKRRRSDGHDDDITVLAAILEKAG